MEQNRIDKTRGVLKALAKMMKQVSFLCVFLLLWATGGAEAAAANGVDETATASAASAVQENDPDLQALLTVLEEETKVATKTKMNNDYVPGMVTVLNGLHMKALGVQTVAEALGTVPGIQASYNRFGEPSASVRGIAFPFNSGNIKIMLNNISLSRESSGINSSVLLIPIAQVDRIEVIRGPGSSIYGDFAMAGVVNIITKTTGAGVYGRSGNDGSYGGGGHYGHTGEKSPVRLDMSLAVQDTGEQASAPAINPSDRQQTGVFHLGYKNFSFTAQTVRRQLSFNGPRRFPGPPPERAKLEENDWVMEGRQHIDLQKNIDLSLYLSFLHNARESQAVFPRFDGDRLETGMDLNIRQFSGHRLLLGISYAASDIDQAMNARSLREQVAVYGVNRKNLSLSLQDQISVTDRFSFTLGGRFDHYDDVGHIFTPRAAGVYRLGEHHVLKAQYARGFRAPTFFELYANGVADDTLDFEVIETTEFSYIFRKPNQVARMTLFLSGIDNGIYPGPQSNFSNHINIESQGIELEWEQKMGKAFRWQTNLSYVDVTDQRSEGLDGDQGLATAAWLANLAVFLEPAPKYMLTGRFNYIGERHTTQGWKNGYGTLDLTLSRMEFIKKGVTLQVGVKNLTDRDISYFSELPTGLETVDFYGRIFWLQLSCDF